MRGLPLVGPEEWVQTREGKSLLDKNDLLMEDAEKPIRSSTCRWVVDICRLAMIALTP